MMSQNAAAEMAGDEFEARKILEYAAHNQPRQRKAAVERPPDARREAEFPHALFPEPDRRRMHEHRDVELGRELEERPGIIVIRKGAAVARIDQHGAQVVLFDGALELAQQVVAAARDRGGDGYDLVLVAVAQRHQVFVRHPDRRQRLTARIGLEIVARVRDHADVEADLVMQTAARSRSSTGTGPSARAPNAHAYASR